MEWEVGRVKTPSAVGESGGERRAIGGGVKILERKQNFSLSLEVL